MFQVTADWAKGYQWRFGNNYINGETNATLAVTNVTQANAGAYSVLLSNYTGFVTSSVATLTVYSTPAGQVSMLSANSGVVQVQVDGVPGMRYAIESSADLKDWIPVTNGIAPYTFEDTNASGSPRMFYRSVWNP